MKSLRIGLVAGALLVGLLAPTFAEPSNEGARFAAKGVAPTLALCHLPLECGGQKSLHRTAKPIRETGNDSIIDERWVEFDGLLIQLFYAASDKSAPPASWEALARQAPAVAELTITSARWPVMDGLRVGTDRSVVERTLGSRVAAGDGACEDFADEATQDSVTFCYADGKVRSIRWTPWWDG